MSIFGLRPKSRLARVRRFVAWVGTSALVVTVVPAVGVLTVVAPPAAAADSCPAGGCSVTVDARDFKSGLPLAHFNYIVNVDNTKLPSDPTSLSTESNSPIVRE